jgi:hypothetical protein
MKQPDMLAYNTQTSDMYKKLFSSQPLAGTIPLANANFWDAYNLYKYVDYMYKHNATVYAGLQNTDVLNDLRIAANNQQLAMNSDMTKSGLKEGDMIRTIPGRTLAQKVLDRFSSNNAYGGFNNKLTLMFGSHEPFLSFFALSRLQNSMQAPNSPFWQVPEPGAAMIFELISETPEDPLNYPSWDDLAVRFLYRKNANPDTAFTEMSIFGSSNTTYRMSYRDFRIEMEKIAVDVSKWCQMCDSINLFCVGRRPNRWDVSSAIQAAVTSPAVAGVIGAVIMLAIVSIVVGAAAFFGRFRIYRADPSRRNSSLGGFKGAEKMASDTDLAITKRGANHERVGSWELRDGSKPAGGTGISKDAFSSNVRNTDDDDAISIYGAPPVKPRETV